MSLETPFSNKLQIKRPENAPGSGHMTLEMSRQGQRT